LCFKLTHQILQISSAYYADRIAPEDVSPPMGEPLRKALAAADAIGPLDLGCVAAHGIFMKNDTGLVVEAGTRAATAFLLELIARLQASATVSMIDVRAYAKFLKG
jgi:hypothetical protein